MLCRICSNPLSTPPPVLENEALVNVCMQCGNIAIWHRGEFRGPTVEELRILWQVPDPVIRAAVEVKAGLN